MINRKEIDMFRIAVEFAQNLPKLSIKVGDHKRNGLAEGREDKSQKGGTIHISLPHCPTNTSQVSSVPTKLTTHSRSFLQVSSQTSRGKETHLKDSRAQQISKSYCSLPAFNVTYSEIFKMLIEKKLIEPRQVKPFLLDHMAKNNPNAICEYHGGARGHTIEECVSFRKSVRALVDKDVVMVKKGEDSIIIKDPTPKLGFPPIDENASGHPNNECLKKCQFGALSMSNSELFEFLKSTKQICPIKVSPIQSPYPSWYDPEKACEFHSGAVGHSIENCNIFMNQVRKGLKKGRITMPNY